LTKAVKRTGVADDPASLEELDQVMYVVSSRTWLALATVGLLLAAATAWGFLGNVLTKVTGQGILIRSGVLFNIVGVSSGQILDVTVTEGQTIRRGTVVARLAQPEIEAELREARTLLTKLDEERSFLEAKQEQNVELVYTYIGKQRTTLEESIRLGTELVKELGELVHFYEQLRSAGTVSRLDLEKWKSELRHAQIRLLQDQQELAGLDLTRHQTDTQMEQNLLELTKARVPVEERVLSLQERLRTFSEVRSLHSGVIVEMHRNPGDRLQEGESVATLEMSPWEDVAAAEDADLFRAKAGKPLVVAFIPPFQGMELRPGMPVHVIPETLSEDEYGVMLGEVQAVSRYPASPKGMMRVLDNQELVDTLTRSGAPVMVTVSLREAPDTPSGYRWSSGLGPPTPIESGTQCMIRVIARSQTPIELIIPYLKGAFG
jgi:HlyD family secretion protein